LIPRFKMILLVPATEASAFGTDVCGERGQAPYRINEHTLLLLLGISERTRSLCSLRIPGLINLCDGGIYVVVVLAAAGRSIDSAHFRRLDRLIMPVAISPGYARRPDVTDSKENNNNKKNTWQHRKKKNNNNNNNNKRYR
jgi:hypothetical protein